MIIGGGVTGLSAAYHLALKRRGRVIVIDKGPVGDGSSSRAAAIVTGHLWSETAVLARKLALRRYRELSSELDGYRFHDVGCLNLFDRPSWPERERLLPLYDRCGAPYEVLDAREMRRRWPDLNPEDNFIGLYDPLGGYSEPDEYLPALAAKCRHLGVEIREHTKLTEVLIAQMNGQPHGQPHAHGVRATCGDIPADTVVITSYAWTNQVLRSVDVVLPVKAFVHQRYVTTPLPRAPVIPAINANPLGGYVRPAAGGRLLLGIETPDRTEHRVTSSDFHTSELSADPALRDTLMRRFAPLVPALRGATWETERIGLITFSMDYEPILGPVGAVGNLFVGVAFHSGGFAYNPATGYLLAEMVAGERTSVDVSAFSPDRFDRDETRDYLSQTVPQSQAGARRRH